MSAGRIPVVLMRGGARRALVFRREDLPSCDRARDALLQRLVAGPQGDAADALGAAGDGNVVLVARSCRDDRDVDCRFGAVPASGGPIEWAAAGCDQLAAAAAVFALSEGLVPAAEGAARVRIGLGAPGRRIDAYVPMRGGEVAEACAADGPAGPAGGAQVRLEFTGSAGGVRGLADGLLPTGNLVDVLEVPGLGPVAATIVGAGRATVFVRADALGLTARELPAGAARMRRPLERLEALRIAAAARLGAVGGRPGGTDADPAAPAIAWVARPSAYRTAGGGEVPADRVDLLARALVGGRVHPGDDGPGAIAIAAAAALPGSVVFELARLLPGVPVRIGQAAGPLAAGVEISQRAGRWRLDRAAIARSARRLLTGWAHLPPAADRARA